MQLRMLYIGVDEPAGEANEPVSLAKESGGLNGLAFERTSVALPCERYPLTRSCGGRRQLRR